MHLVLNLPSEMGLSGAMGNYKIYSRFVLKSVNHIFSNFLGDNTVEEVFEAQSTDKDLVVAVEISGTLKGELLITIPRKTIDRLTRSMMQGQSVKSFTKYHADVAGEIANMISGTFVNQLQYLEHKVRLSAPEINDDPITVKALYDNINMSFISSFGGFDIDLFYRDET